LVRAPFSFAQVPEGGQGDNGVICTYCELFDLAFGILA